MNVISADTRVAGVIGWPVRHSLSPVIHNAGFRSTGFDAVYVAFPVAPGDVGAALESLRRMNLLGLSVTMPHKADVAGLVDEIDEAAAALRSVNTVHAVDGRLVGHSTDGDGLVASLDDAGVAVRGATVLVVGSGGAGRAVVDAMRRHGASEMIIANRTPTSASQASVLFAGSETVQLDDRKSMADVLERSTLVVNCTSVGMVGTESQDRSPFDVALLNDRHVVVDLVYRPTETVLLAGARRRGCRAVGGLGMLVHQAALQQRIWTGTTPDIGAMTAAATNALG